MSTALTMNQILARISEREAKVESIMADHTARMDMWSQKVGPSRERDDDKRVKRLADQKLIELIPFLKDNHPDAYYAFLNRNKDENEEDTSLLETSTKAVKQIVEAIEHPAVLAGISNIAGEIPTDSAWRRQSYNTRETRGEKSHLDTIREAARAKNPSPEDPDDDGSDDGTEKSNRSDRRGPPMRPPRALFDNAMTQIGVAKTPSGRKLHNVPTPAKYSGTTDQPEHLRAWKYAVQAYLLGNALNPGSCLAFTHILNLTEKRANDFMAKRIVPEVMREFDVKAGGTNSSPITFDELIEAFEKKFVDPEYRRRAISELESLRQRDNRGNYVRVRDIADKIEDLCESTNERSEWQMKRYFIDAVDYKIAAAINRVMAWERDSVLLDHLVTVAAREEQSLLAERSAREAFQQGKKFSNYNALIAKPAKYTASNEQPNRKYQQQWRSGVRRAEVNTHHVTAKNKGRAQSKALATPTASPTAAPATARET